MKTVGWFLVLLTALAQFSQACSSFNGVFVANHNKTTDFEFVSENGGKIVTRNTYRLNNQYVTKSVVIDGEIVSKETIKNPKATREKLSSLRMRLDSQLRPILNPEAEKVKLAVMYRCEKDKNGLDRIEHLYYRDNKLSSKSTYQMLKNGNISWSRKYYIAKTSPFKRELVRKK